MMTIAGVSVSPEQVRGTIKLIGYYRRFLRSDYERCRDADCQGRGNGPGSWDILTREQARRRLAMLIHVAINRKAGIPDVACRKQSDDYQTRIARDCRGVRDAVNRRCRAWGLNGRRWDTDEIQRRFGHLLEGNE